MELLNEIGKRAKTAKYDVQKYTTQMKNEALIYIADKLTACSEEILNANRMDIDKAKEPLYSTKVDEERAGLGFTIMDVFSDEMTVESSVGDGCSVKIIKKIDKYINGGY